MPDFTTQETDTNWLEVVSSELRAWWEVVGRGGQARNPDPIYVIPPPLVATPLPGATGLGSMNQNTMLLIGGAVLLFILMNK